MYIILKNCAVINTTSIHFNSNGIDWAVPTNESVSFAFYHEVASICHEDPRLAPIDDHHAGYAEVLPF